MMPPKNKPLEEEEDVADIDFSVIRDAISLGGSVVQQLLNGVHYGAPEVRHLILNECDIILECKVCRNLFRGLANFIAHKRVYCCEYHQKRIEPLPMSLIPAETVIVEVTDPDSEDSRDESNKSTSSIAEQVLSEKFAGKTESYKFYTQIAQQVSNQRFLSQTTTVKLTNIKTNANAVHVSIETDNTALNDVEMVDANRDDNPLSQPLKKDAETHPVSAILKEEHVIKPENPKEETPRESSRIMQNNLKASSHLSNKSPEKTYDETICDFATLKCVKCETTYTTRKSLMHHVTALHSESRTVYPCPYCKAVFGYFWGLTRHLMKNHRKKKDQIDKMRKKLHQAAYKTSVSKNNNENIPNSPGKKTTPAKSSTTVRVDASAKNSKPVSKETSSKVSTKDSSTKKTLLKEGSSKMVTNGPKDITSKVQKGKPKESVSNAVVKSSKESMEQSRQQTAAERKMTILDQMKASLTSPQFSTGWKLHICDYCRKIFGKGENLSSHMQQCASAPKVLQNKKKARKVKENAKSKAESPNNKGAAREKRSEETANSEKKANGESRRCGSAGEGSLKLQSNQPVKKVSAKNRRQPTISKSRDVKRAQKAPMHSCCDNPADVTQSVEMERTPIDKQPHEKVRSNRIYVMDAKRMDKPFCQDSKKIDATVDESDLVCLKCNFQFKSISNLRRHAIRHLGWKRFKCKLCKFSSYHKSECNSHLWRTHPNKARTAASLDHYLVDLNKEASRVRTEKKQQTRKQTKRAEEQELAASPEKKRQKKGDNSRKAAPVKFNISTRNSPRQFDVRPYLIENHDPVSTLRTRKGSYKKPNLLEQVAMTQKRDGEGTDDERLSHRSSDTGHVGRSSSIRRRRSHDDGSSSSRRSHDDGSSSDTGFGGQKSPKISETVLAKFSHETAAKASPKPNGKIAEDSTAQGGESCAVGCMSQTDTQHSAATVKGNNKVPVKSSELSDVTGVKRSPRINSMNIKGDKSAKPEPTISTGKSTQPSNFAASRNLNNSLDSEPSS